MDRGTLTVGDLEELIAGAEEVSGVLRGGLLQGRVVDAEGGSTVKVNISEDQARGLRVDDINEMEHMGGGLGGVDKGKPLEELEVERDEPRR